MKTLVLSIGLLIAAGAECLAETTSTAAGGGETQITWYGHAAFQIRTPAGHVLLVDPWVTNPSNPHGKEDLAAIRKADLILVSHGHFDHVGDAVELGKRTGAKLVSTFDLGQAIVNTAGYPKDAAGFDTQGNFGGELQLLNGDVKIAFIPAIHSSCVTRENGKGAPPELHDGGNPGGFLITIKGGPTVYHTGDTDLFSDMSLVSKFHKVDVMLACIGDHFTMGPARAAEAVKLVQPTTVVPMHFGTFPVLTGKPADFEKALKDAGSTATMRVLKIGEPTAF